MQWIEGFERLGGDPHLVVVSPTGERSLTPFKQLRSAAPERRGARRVELSGVGLDAFRECGPQEYLDLAGFEPTVSSNHRVYELTTPSARLLIPASVMMLGVFSRIWDIAPWIFSAASLDFLAVPTFDGDKPTVTFFPNALRSGRHDEDTTQVRFLWLTCFPSARRAWDSVASSAGAGRLSFDLPKASITGAARGQSRGNTVIVTRLHINDITPNEAPRPHAAALAGKTFRVSPRTELISEVSPGDTLREGLNKCMLLA